jgi:flagellar biosynthesis anti-sigma factor FlgM
LKISLQDTVNTISKSQADRIYEQSKQTADKARSSGTNSVSGDSVDIGSQNDLLALAQNTGTGTNAGRLEQLRSLIASGQYQVDAGALSQSMVSAALNGF